MEAILLTQQGGILKPFAWVLGKILEGIYFVCDKIFFRGNGSIGSVGIICICIILFTIIVRLLMFPMQLKQQKFTKLSSLMTPEIQAVQKKYENRKDQQSQLAMQQEITAIYEKYGTSPTGSCLQLIIQMPILLALYRVIMNIPAYVGQVKSFYLTIINQLSPELISSNFNIKVNAVSELTMDQKNTIIDTMSGYQNKAFDLKALIDAIGNSTATDAYNHIRNINQLFNFNLSDSPASMWASIGVLALIIPILAGVTQFISTQLTMKMSAATTNTADNPAMSSMKVMNYLMPLMSIWFCWQFAAGIGVYWITGSVILIIQQIALNAYFKKITVDDIIKENQEKAKKKREKRGYVENQITNAAAVNTKNINTKSQMSNKEKEEKLEKAKQAYSNNLNKDKNSISSRANMVKQFNERNK